MTIILTSDELADLTGYRTPKRQVKELRRIKPTYVRNGVCMRAARYKGLSQQESDQVHSDPLDAYRTPP